jgi:hypothetical protein
MKAIRLHAIAWLAFLLLAACATVGDSTGDTFNQKLAVGYITVSQVRTTATALLAAGKITIADAQNIQVQADAARTGLDIARGFAGADKDVAIGRLQMVTTILSAASAYLASRQ